MHLDFEYTPDDLRELTKVVRRNNSPAEKKQFGRGLIGWFLFIGLALLMVFLLNQNHARPAPVTVPSPHQNQSWSSILVNFIPWLLAVSVVIYLSIGIRFPSNAVLQKKLSHQSVNSMDIQEIGVRSASGASETLWKWEAFDRADETDTGFFLRLTNTRTYVMIPKRAIADPSQVEELRQILLDHVQTPTGAFPVIPISP